MTSPSLTDEMIARQALRRLREARDLLRLIGAAKALAKTQRAIASTEGAARHAALREQRTGRSYGMDAICKGIEDGQPIR